MKPFFWDPAKNLAWDLSASDAKALNQLLEVPMRKLANSEYDKRFGKLTLCHTPQAHILAAQGLFWLISLSDVAQKGRVMDGPHGLHVLLLAHKGMRYGWVTPAHMRKRPSIHKLVEKCWFWWLGEAEDALSRKLTPAHKRALERVLDA